MKVTGKKRQEESVKRDEMEKSKDERKGKVEEM